MPPKTSGKKLYKDKITPDDIDIKTSSGLSDVTTFDSEVISSTNEQIVDEKHEKFEDYPMIFEMPKIKESIFETEPDVKFSSNIDFPKSGLGFHHFVHQSKNNFAEATKMFEGKKKVFRVVNKYETTIDNTNESISGVATEYFNLSNKPEILSRAYYKLWEILMTYELIDLDKEKFISAHLAEGPGAFIQAVIMYRDMFCKKGLSKNDRYHAITLHPEGKSFVPEMDAKFNEFYDKESPKRVHLHKTHSIQTAGKSKTKDNGDITDPKTMKLFGGEIKDKCDFITADGGFENVNENLQEQEAFRLVLSEIINAVRIQKKGGHFVCKFFETFTLTSCKMIAILNELYEKVHFIKPLTSRGSNSEKYVVCMNFKYDENNKEYKKIITALEKLMSLMHNNKSEYVVGIYDDFVVPKELRLAITNMNITIANYQLKNINMMITFIKGNIYSGDEYYDRRKIQIDGAKYWIDIYFPKQSDLLKSRQKCKQMAKTTHEQIQKDVANLSKRIIDIV
jgi:23S rRNA U2552 (ribose-2'-O)-methylase RlmE/FtsJ